MAARLATDLTGKHFGRLNVLKMTRNRRGKLAWECRCDCGNVIVTSASHLTSGHTKSCGCLQKEMFSKTVTKHGKTGNRVLGIWYGMRKRCYYEKDRHFADYGGRGITICDEWKNDFQPFYDWAMSHGYAENLTIDRIDVNGNYCPDNCRWITNEEQQNNRRTSHYLTYNGETHTIKDWAKITGIKYRTLLGRINSYKWDTEKALTVATKTRGEK